MVPQKRNLQECSGFAVKLRPFKGANLDDTGSNKGWQCVLINLLQTEVVLPETADIQRPDPQLYWPLLPTSSRFKPTQPIRLF